MDFILHRWQISNGVHKPVLTKEVLEVLNPQPNENFIDCTIGEGGHAKLILEKTGPAGKVLGIDWDLQQIENCKLLLKDFGNRLILVNDSYANLGKIVEEKKFKPVNGILLDLGMSSWQLEESGKGFSFLKDEILDMRYDSRNNSLTARKILDKWPEKEIEKILREYGQERFARQIAKKIVEERKIKPVKSTFQLIELIKKTVPVKFQRDRIHCATKTFQALRIAVNDELQNLKKVLPQAVSALSSGERLAVISFHSLEDRIVKNFLKNVEKEKNVKILLKKPITASKEEIKSNPRARSAKLRVAVKI